MKGILGDFTAFLLAAPCLNTGPAPMPVEFQMIGNEYIIRSTISGPIVYLVVFWLWVTKEVLTSTRDDLHLIVFGYIVKFSWRTHHTTFELLWELCYCGQLPEGESAANSIDQVVVSLATVVWGTLLINLLATIMNNWRGETSTSPQFWVIYHSVAINY